VVDATLIAALSSTKNASGERDPEMHQTKKGNQWYFGMKAHIGVDADSGLVHTVKGTAANVNDVVEANSLLHGEETDAFGDAGYQGVAKRPDACEDVQWHVGMRPGKRRALDKTRKVDALVDQLERLKASIRAKVEHPFPVVKRQFGHVKVRYRGLKKNTAQLTTLFALSNLWMARRALLVLDRGASPLAESGHPGRTGWSAACADAASQPRSFRGGTQTQAAGYPLNPGISTTCLTPRVQKSELALVRPGTASQARLSWSVAARPRPSSR
jgi:IS5 family transposase